MQDRLISGTEKPEDHFDRAIRPTSLADYIGQPVVREQMEIFIGAARGRGEALDHTCLLYTSPSPRDCEESRMPSSA
nr:hypothetical protein [Klebsiella pneumoniae]